MNPSHNKFLFVMRGRRLFLYGSGLVERVVKGRGEGRGKMSYMRKQRHSLYRPFRTYTGKK